MIKTFKQILKVKIIIFLIAVFILHVSCGSDDENEPRCITYNNIQNIELENPTAEQSLVSDIIVEDDVLISDVNINIKTRCEDIQCGLDFSSLRLVLINQDISPLAIGNILLVDSFEEGGETFTDTTFDAEADNDLNINNRPYTGTFKPAGDLTEFYGKSSKGTWSIVFDEPGMSGVSFNTVLDEWSIEICGE